MVKNGDIIATGFNGAPDGEESCKELGVCARDVLRTKNGEAYNVCKGVHSEMRALINAGLEKTKDSTIYLVAIDVKTGKKFRALPCELCARLVKHAQIKEVICHNGGE